MRIAWSKIWTRIAVYNYYTTNAFQTGFCSFGLAISLEEEELNSNQVYATLKLTLCHILPETVGLDKRMFQIKGLIQC